MTKVQLASLASCFRSTKKESIHDSPNHPWRVQTCATARALCWLYRRRASKEVKLPLSRAAADGVRFHHRRSVTQKSARHLKRWRARSNLIWRQADWLAHFEVLRRFLAAIAHDFILDLLPLIKGGQSCALDRGNVNKDILTAALRRNESVSLGRVEPFHCSGCHAGLLALCSCKRSRA